MRNSTQEAEWTVEEERGLDVLRVIATGGRIPEVEDTFLKLGGGDLGFRVQGKV